MQHVFLSLITILLFGFYGGLVAFFAGIEVQPKKPMLFYAAILLVASLVVPEFGRIGWVAFGMTFMVVHIVFGIAHQLYITSESKKRNPMKEIK